MAPLRYQSEQMTELGHSMNQMCKTFLKSWLILWILCLPLVHIHPEADHAHGMPGHVHGGTFHTVLSGTPICAYENHRHHHDSFVHGEPVGSSNSPSHPPHGLEHTAYGFSVLNAALHPLVADMADDVNEDALHSVIESGIRVYVSSFPGTTDYLPAFRRILLFPSPRAPPLEFL